MQDHESSENHGTSHENHGRREQQQQQQQQQVETGGTVMSASMPISEDQEANGGGEAMEAPATAAASATANVPTASNSNPEVVVPTAAVEREHSTRNPLTSNGTNTIDLVNSNEETADKDLDLDDDVDDEGDDEVRQPSSGVPAAKSLGNPLVVLRLDQGELRRLQWHRSYHHAADVDGCQCPSTGQGSHDHRVLGPEIRGRSVARWQD